MSAPQQRAATPSRTTEPQPQSQRETEQQRNARLLREILDKPFEYKPFLSEEKLTLTPRNVMLFLCRPTKSGAVCTEQQALRFCMLCKARGLNPWEGDAYIVGYDTKDGPEFSLITAHQAFLKRAEVHPEYDGMQSGVLVRRTIADGNQKLVQTLELEGDYFEPGDVLVGGWAKVHFKTRKFPMYKRLGLTGFDKGFSRWNADKAGMIVKCAEADALRSSFPNSLGGMYLAEEFSDNGQEVRVEPTTKTESMKNRLAESARRELPDADNIKRVADPAGLGTAVPQTVLDAYDSRAVDEAQMHEEMEELLGGSPRNRDEDPTR